MRTLLTALFLSLGATLSAAAAPSVKVINFTADWCPNCQILNPRLEEAMEAFDAGSIERVDLDVTRIRPSSTPVERAEVQTELLLLADEHQVAYLWDWYGGVTGIAVAVAADNGEPLTCFMRPMTAKAIKGQLRLAKMLAEQGTPGERAPDGPNCPVLR